MYLFMEKRDQETAGKGDKLENLWCFGDTFTKGKNCMSWNSINHENLAASTTRKRGRYTAGTYRGATSSLSLNFT